MMEPITTTNNSKHLRSFPCSAYRIKRIRRNYSYVV